jgi:pimeloyl-ACP methyl ester carboxylesterase
MSIFCHIVRYIVLALPATTMMFLVAVLFRVITPILFPSISVAYLNADVFHPGVTRDMLLHPLVYGPLLAALYCWLLRFMNGDKLRGVRAGAALGFLLAVFIAVPAATAQGSLLQIRLPISLWWCAEFTCQYVLGGIAIGVCGRGTTAASEPGTRGLIRRSVVTTMIAFLATVGFGLVYYVLPAPRPDSTIRVTLEDGTEVQVDVFRPPRHAEMTEAPAAIFLLHGVEGTSPLAKRLHYLNARAISNEEYVVFFVHYFDGCDYTDLRRLVHEDQDGLDAFEEFRKTNDEYRRWVDTALGTMTKLIADPAAHGIELDANRVAVIGYSLGTYVGSAAVAKWPEDRAPRPKAFVGNFGAIWDETVVDERFPRSLFIHGRNDKIVPVAWAEEAVRRLQAAGVPATLKVYADEGHVVSGRAGWDARLRTYEFVAAASAVPQCESTARRRL